MYVVLKILPTARLSCVKWSESPAVPCKFPFVGKPGLQVEPVNPEYPISYFEIVFPPNIIKTIVDSTNAFARQSDSNWSSTTEKEILQLFGTYINHNNEKVWHIWVHP